jgi:phosphatidylserine/phosphatidylglycerophosphate/cardiolipin synthase-like enzyme
VSLTVYRGDGSALLAFDIDQHLVTPLFAGFAVQATAPDGTREWLMNRLNFATGLDSTSTPAQRQAAWTDSNLAPFQKYRWQHFPARPQLGTWVYTLTPMFFATAQSAKLKPGPISVSASIEFVAADYPELRIGFTRSFVSSQAYAEKFKNAPIRQLPKVLDFNTTPFEAQYEFLGYTARKLLFDFLAETAHSEVRLDVFAYDFDEPDVLKALEGLGSRLRIWLDDAPLHNAAASFAAQQKAAANAKSKKGSQQPKTLAEWQAGILEEEVHTRLIASAGAANVKRGHFSRFAHDKVMIQRDAKTNRAIKVLTGSANFSIRGLYVQANNILVFDDPATAGVYAAAFDEVWKEKNAATSATEFAACPLSQDWTPRSTDPGLPPFDICLSPHRKPKSKATDLVSLQKVAAAIDKASASVLFAVMELAGGGSVMTRLSKEQAANKNVFWYGITQNVSPAKKAPAAGGDAVEEHTTGVTVRQPDGSQVLVPFAFLHGNVPPPFDQEVNGGPGQVIHNKFVVVDFNGANPAVFTGSSNLADGGEEANGDNLIGIYDRGIAVRYGVEAIRLIDHFGFRAALTKAQPAKPGKKGAAAKSAGAKAAPGTKPLQLQSPGGSDPRWWEDYYKSGTAKFNERTLFIK